MSDLINRKDAIKALEFEQVHMTAYCDGKNEGNPFESYNKGLDDGIKALKGLPSAEPERKTGKWISVESNTVNGICSVCGYESHLYENDVYGEHYCPNCGAWLRLE